MADVQNIKETAKKHQSDITGHFILYNPIFVFVKPRLFLYRKEGKGKVEGEICLPGFKRKLRFVKHKEKEWIFQLDVNIVTVDIVMKFITADAIEGFLDTPVGHIKFAGKKVR